LNQKKKAWISKIAWIIFIIYMIFLVYFLFFSERYGRTVSREYRYNLELFKEIKRFIAYRELLGIEIFIVNIVGNILAFAPFGFTLPIISVKNRKFFNITLLTIEFSLTVELLQLLLKLGSFDVDDIFLNTIGGMLGYLFFAICRRICSKRKKKE
jgi:glycopeptide antibiotics resistance protein